MFTRNVQEIRQSQSGRRKVADLHIIITPLKQQRKLGTALRQQWKHSRITGRECACQKRPTLRVLTKLVYLKYGVLPNDEVVWVASCCVMGDACFTSGVRLNRIFFFADYILTNLVQNYNSSAVLVNCLAGLLAVPS